MSSHYHKETSHNYENIFLRLIFTGCRLMDQHNEVLSHNNDSISHNNEKP